MQCTSYTPVYYHPRDLNVGASGYGGWDLYESNASYGEERGYNGSMPLCDQYVGYDKEVLKQIIQNHEATFRFQVQELHRLHRRQRDLMEEMRVREIFKQHLLSRASESIHSSSHSGAEISQKPSPATDWLLGSLSSGRNAQGIRSFAPENSHKPTTIHTDSFVRSNSEYDAKFLSPSSEWSGNRIADLEYAASTYCDDQVKKFKAENLSEAPALTCCTPEKVSNFHHASDSDIGSIKTWDLSSSGSDNRGKSCFIDLNEPIQVEPLPIRLSGAITGHRETVCSNKRVPLEAKPESIVLTHSQLMKSSESSLDCANSLMTIDLNSVPVNVFSETEMTPESIPSMKIPVSRKFSEDEEAIVHNDMDDSFIDLNTRPEDEHSLPPSSSAVEISAVEIKSAEYMEPKGPGSPQNQERSPPIRKSEDTLLGMPRSCEQGEGEPLIELETTAAETLVMILSSEVKGAAVLEPLANFRNLCWFAGIVSSNGDELENEIMKLKIDAAENGEGEENTLNLSRFNKSKGTGNMPRRCVKGSKRGKKQCKNIKTDISKDVEGFSERGPSKRKPGRNISAKPKKCSKLSPLDVTKKSMSLILKDSAASSDHGVVQRWGKTRKRGGRKCRVMNSLS